MVEVATAEKRFATAARWNPPFAAAYLGLVVATVQGEKVFSRATTLHGAPRLWVSAPRHCNCLGNSMHSPSFSSTASAAVSINSDLVLAAQPLTPAAFAPFGQVVAVDGQAATLPQRSINSGNARRYDLLADLQLTADGGVPTLALFRAQARQFPLQVVEMERHALGSQTFVPLGTQRFVVVVARPGPAPQAADLHAFITDGRQGVVLAPGTWHHALLAVEGGDFAVVERRAAQVDCDVCGVDPALTVALLQ